MEHSFDAFVAEAWALLLQPTTWFVGAVVLVSGVVRGFSGFGGALIFIPLTAAVLGPVVIAYWLSSTAAASVIRANIMSFYAVTSTTTDIVFFFNGLFTWDVLVYALLAWPLYMIGLAVGARVFKGTNDRQYRISAYVLIGVSALISLPLFDAFIR